MQGSPVSRIFNFFAHLKHQTQSGLSTQSSLTQQQHQNRQNEGPNIKFPDLRGQDVQVLVRLVPTASQGRGTRQRRCRAQPAVVSQPAAPHRLECPPDNIARGMVLLFYFSPYDWDNTTLVCAQFLFILLFSVLSAVALNISTPSPLPPSTAPFKQGDSAIRNSQCLPGRHTRARSGRTPACPRSSASP